jgi:hypothetical protein
LAAAVAQSAAAARAESEVADFMIWKSYTTNVGGLCHGLFESD